MGRRFYLNSVHRSDAVYAPDRTSHMQRFAIAALMLAVLAVCVGLALGPSATQLHLQHRDTTVKHTTLNLSAREHVNRAMPPPRAFVARTLLSNPSLPQQPQGPTPSIASSTQLPQRERAPSHADPQPPSLRNNLEPNDAWGASLSMHLSGDLMPLIDECYANARERDPNLGRAADVFVDVVADEHEGGIIEAAELGHDSDIKDPTFIECIRESVLSTQVPLPDGKTRSVMLSLRFDHDEE